MVQMFNTAFFVDCTYKINQYKLSLINFILVTNLNSSFIWAIAFCEYGKVVKNSLMFWRRHNAGIITTLLIKLSLSRASAYRKNPVKILFFQLLWKFGMHEWKRNWEYYLIQWSFLRDINITRLRRKWKWIEWRLLHSV